MGFYELLFGDLGLLLCWLSRYDSRLLLHQIRTPSLLPATITPPQNIHKLDHTLYPSDHRMHKPQINRILQPIRLSNFEIL